MITRNGCNVPGAGVPVLSGVDKAAGHESTLVGHSVADLSFPDAARPLSVPAT